MEKRVLWLCIAVGSTIGGFIPEAWHASGFGVEAILGSAIGAAAGVWAAARLNV